MGRTTLVAPPDSVRAPANGAREVGSEAGAAVDVSVLVPARGRTEPLASLYREYASELRSCGIRFEFVFLMDRGAPAIVKSLLDLAAEREPVRVLYAENAVSDTVLIRTAAARTTGDIILLLPPVRRVAAAGLAVLIERVRLGADVAVAARHPRHFDRTGRLRTRLFHFMLRMLTGTTLSDLPCGVRAIRRDVFGGIALYGDLIPYLPVLASRDGYLVEEVAIPQHPDDHTIGFHGPGTHFRKVMDLLNLFFLLRFADRPLRFFGLTGTLSAVTGAVLLFAVFVQRLGGQPLANRPILVLAVLLLILGVQAIALGLIGEVIVHLHASNRRPYRVAWTSASDGAQARSANRGR